jgi:hypothetical protein
MPQHTPSERARGGKSAKKRAGGRGNRAARTAGAVASGAAAGAAVGGVARGGRRAAGAIQRARPTGSVSSRGTGMSERLRGLVARATSGVPQTGGLASRARDFAARTRLDPGSVIREGESRAARGAMTAAQAGAIQPPHNSPAMSSFKSVGGISGRK